MLTPREKPIGFPKQIDDTPNRVFGNNNADVFLDGGKAFCLFAVCLVRNVCF